MAKRGNRHDIVLATKYTSPYKSDWKKNPIQVNYTGNSAKSLHVSIEDSLRKLQTDYIDLMYVHWWYVLYHFIPVTLGITPHPLRKWLTPLMP